MAVDMVQTMVRHEPHIKVSISVFSFETEDVPPLKVSHC